MEGRLSESEIIAREVEKIKDDYDEHRRYADRMRELYPFIKEYDRKKHILNLLGYKIDDMFELKIWKEKMISEEI